MFRSLLKSLCLIFGDTELTKKKKKYSIIKLTRNRHLSFPLSVHRKSIFRRVLLTLLILAVCRTRVTTNLVNITSLNTSLTVAQWLELPAVVRKVIGSIPVKDSHFFYLCLTFLTLNIALFSSISYGLFSCVPASANILGPVS